MSPSQEDLVELANHPRCQLLRFNQPLTVGGSSRFAAATAG